MIGAVNVRSLRGRMTFNHSVVACLAASIFVSSAIFTVADAKPFEPISSSSISTADVGSTSTFALSEDGISYLNGNSASASFAYGVELRHIENAGHRSVWSDANPMTLILGLSDGSVVSVFAEKIGSLWSSVGPINYSTSVENNGAEYSPIAIVTDAPNLNPAFGTSTEVWRSYVIFPSLGDIAGQIVQATVRWDITNLVSGLAANPVDLYQFYGNVASLASVRDTGRNFMLLGTPAPEAGHGVMVMISIFGAYLVARKRVERIAA